MKRIRTVGVLIVILIAGCTNNKKHYIGMDKRIFKGTIAWNLACAVYDEDTLKIKEQIIEKKIPVDFQEPYYGNTVLMNAVMNRSYTSVECLLKLGANPNLYSDTINHIGENAVVLASKFDRPSKILKLILDYGGDPNSRCSGSEITTKDCRSSYHSNALAEAVGYSIESEKKVKLLVEYGADVNQRIGKEYPIALKEALILNMKIALYLLKNGADYTCDFSDHIFSNERESILVVLRRNFPKLNSNEYYAKKEVIKFLKERGLDYDKEPITPALLKRIQNLYPDTWEEYIKVY